METYKVPIAWPTIPRGAKKAVQRLPYRTCSRCGDKKLETLTNFRYRNEKGRELQFRSMCRICELHQRKLWGERNKEKIYDYKHKPEYIEHARQYAKKYSRLHKADVVFWNVRRRIRKQLLESHFARKEWEKMKKDCAYTCQGCLQTEPTIILTVDHIIPLIRGGKDTIDNIQPLCRSCNSKKGAKLITPVYA